MALLDGFLDDAALSVAALFRPADEDDRLAAAGHEAPLAVERHVGVVQGVHPREAAPSPRCSAVRHTVSRVAEVVEEDPDTLRSAAAEHQRVLGGALDPQRGLADVVLLADRVQQGEELVPGPFRVPPVLPERYALLRLVDLGAVVDGGSALGEHVPNEGVPDQGHVVLAVHDNALHVVVVDLVAEGVEVPVEATGHLLGHALA
mmetsp:Transcript_51992/g.134082  ORF Transcript_51992/g.134082 Transcript_51992/m.134082 type:complete len:204 (+) Transcript_51992:89-700(+)